MVRAIVVREAGAPWALESVELPEPGPGQVRVRVDGVGLCRTDVSLARGHLMTPFPLVPGHEGVGTVLSTGPLTDGYAPGDRVLFIWTARCGECWYCTHGQGHLCQRSDETAGAGRVTLADGATAHPALGLGAFAEEIVTSVRQLRPLPAVLPDAEAAVLGCAVATGFGAVRNTARVRAGESVVVVGVGGVGLSVLQTARDLGAHPVIAVDPVAERRELALRMGADAAQAPGLTLARRIRDATGGLGADHVFECVGRAATIRQAWGLTRRGGQVIVVGAGQTADQVQFSAFELFHSARTLRGSVHGDFDPVRDLPLLVERVTAGGIDLARLVDPPRSLDQIAEALDALEAGRGGRAVFLPTVRSDVPGEVPA
jgi:S-(hydroxymethyl)glutathione dehydrogenase/alcohol dehydrogenase